MSRVAGRKSEREGGSERVSESERGGECPPARTHSLTRSQSLAVARSLAESVSQSVSRPGLDEESEDQVRQATHRPPSGSALRRARCAALRRCVRRALARARWSS